MNRIKTSFFHPSRPRLFGHRGYPAQYPENTLESFQGALQAGVKYLELDAWVTKDGQIAVHHDETLSRSCGINKYIKELTLQELKKYDPGWGFLERDNTSRPFYGKGLTIATLEEVCQSFPKAYLNIEIKDRDPLAPWLVKQVLIKNGIQEHVLLASSYDHQVQKFRYLVPGVPTSFGREEIVSFFNWVRQGCEEIYEPPAQALQIPQTYQGEDLIGPWTIKAAHMLDVEIHVWTVNNADQMKTLLEMGIDGIMSDDADLMMQQAGQKV